MKKFITFCLALVMVVSLASCDVATGTSGDLSTEDKAAEATKLTTEELLVKAKAETGSFIAYGNTSRITTAMTNFIAKYGEELGLNGDNANASKQTDTEIYTLLSSEYTSKDNSKAASVVLVQDSATLETYRSNTKMLVNYIPNGAASYVTSSDELVPMVHQYINKLFIWNNTAGEAAPAFTNVWELTEEKYAGKIYFKSPASEQVNMNFLIMLTSDEWVAKLATAYKAYYGTEYVAEEAYENIGYKWIAEFLKNADITSYTSDTKMAAGVSKAENADKVGLFVLSKLRDSSVTQENLTVGAWQEASITPFAGFMYAIYAQVAANGPRPYTAMLFINYIMTEEGFAPWLSSVGGYSVNTTIAPYEGDKTIGYYRTQLVVEDGKYIASVKTKVEDFVSKLIA